MSEDRTFSFFRGLFIGAIAGIAAGILLAPKSGEETREDLKKLSLEFEKKATELYNQAIPILQKKITTIKELGGKINEEKYMSIVSDVVKEIQTKGGITADAAQEIGKQLRKDWTLVKKELAK
jgi:gas vesicle protein